MLLVMEEIADVVRNMDIAEVLQPSSQEHVQERIAKQAVNTPVRPSNEKVSEVLQIVASEAHPRRVAEETVDLPRCFGLHLKSAKHLSLSRFWASWCL